MRKLFRKIRIKYQIFVEDDEKMRNFTIFMIVFILLRILSIFYCTMILELDAGFWGIYQLPFAYPFYVIGLLLCFMHLSKRSLDHIKMFGFHLFTIVLTIIDVSIYIISIDKAWHFWIF